MGMYRNLVLVTSFFAILLTANAQEKGDTVVADSVALDHTIGNDATDTIKNEKEENYMRLVNRLYKSRGWINNRNSDNHRGIYGYVKGVYYGDNKIFFLVELKNTTNIDYEVESFIFISNSIKNGRRQLAPDETIYTPIWRTDFDVIKRKSSMKVVFVFNKFVVAENKNVLFSMYEQNGERNLVLKITPDYFLKAEYLH